MSEHHQTGKAGEQIACTFLEQKGFQILETNWHTSHLEVDIIARNDELLIIAEVKSRKSRYFGEPQESVTRSKQRLLIKAANEYLDKNQLDLEVRFDIITVLFNDSLHQVNHIEDAFYPTL